MKNLNRFKTDFLFSTPSLLSGAGTVMNIAGNYYEFNESNSVIEADDLAIREDFNMVGQDISDALKKLKSDIKKS